MKKHWFPKKIPYQRDGDKSITPCPHGGRVDPPEGKWPERRWDGAMVGSHCCDHCDFNKGTEWEYVMCNRKREEPEEVGG